LREALICENIFFWFNIKINISDFKLSLYNAHLALCIFAVTVCQLDLCLQSIDGDTAILKICCFEI
jgi:hypothetical protein